jgi:hypothetical protein
MLSFMDGFRRGRCVGTPGVLPGESETRRRERRRVVIAVTADLVTVCSVDEALSHARLVRGLASCDVSSHADPACF